MENLLNIIENLENIDVNTLVDRFFKENREFILNLNREQLYEYGEDSEMVFLGEYKESTKTIKKRKGQRYDHITLNDTGKFYKSFTLKLQGNELVYDANPFKFTETGEKVNLFELYGVNVLGLNKENKEIVLIKLYEWIEGAFNSVFE